MVVCDVMSYSEILYISADVSGESSWELMPIKAPGVCKVSLLTSHDTTTLVTNVKNLESQIFHSFLWFLLFFGTNLFYKLGNITCQWVSGFIFFLADSHKPQMFDHGSPTDFIRPALLKVNFSLWTVKCLVMLSSLLFVLIPSQIWKLRGGSIKILC
jgi:hypothetical protein